MNHLDNWTPSLCSSFCSSQSFTQFIPWHSLINLLGLRQKFRNIFIIYLLYSSYNKSSWPFKVEAFVWSQLSASSLISVFVLQGEELLHRIFYLLLVTEALWTQKVGDGLERVIIWGANSGWGINSIPSSSWSLFQIIWVVWSLVLSCCRRAHFLLINLCYIYSTIANIYSSCLEQTCELPSHYSIRHRVSHCVWKVLYLMTGSRS